MNQASINRVIIFDLDGTVIDTRQRSFELFTRLGNSPLSSDQYFNLKSCGIGNREILKNNLGWTVNHIQEFEKQWLNLIEDSEWLKFDSIFPFTIDALSRMISLKYDLWLVTARQNETTLYHQLEQLDLRKYFKKILITKGLISKAELISQENKNERLDFLVGDTEQEIIAAKQLDVPVISVLSGARNRNFLIKAGATQIENTISDFASSLSL